jgi:hypothetical protein
MGDEIICVTRLYFLHYFTSLFQNKSPFFAALEANTPINGKQFFFPRPNLLRLQKQGEKQATKSFARGTNFTTLRT